MKKMIYLFILVFSLSTLVACSDDEGTPVFTEPTEFVLNVPKYASGIYDLKNTATIQLTCSQPDYGFTAATRYTVEIALDQAFEKNATLDTKYSTAKMEVDAQEVAVAISNLLGVNEDEFPKAPIPLYVRLTASALTDNKSEIAGSTITSNIIELPQVLPYYALPAVTLPTNLYLIGSDLIRFGKFTKEYAWDYKGGPQEGIANIDSKFNIYPISDKDLTANPNLVQNPGYATLK